MTPAQTELLQRLIAAERNYYGLKRQGGWVDPDWRGVEVGGLSGISMATAESLRRAGLVEVVGVTRHLRRAFLCRGVPE